MTFGKPISAPNLIEELIAGTGISVDGNKISNSGIVTLSAGTGITIDGSKITNSGITSLAAGTGISVSGSTITNTGITSLTAGTGISVSGSTITNTLDLSGSGWTDSGATLKLTTITDSVGIGIATPTSKLHVVGTSNLAGDVTLGTASTDDVTILGAISAGSSIIPSTDLGADLGSNAYRFNNIWAANINSNSSQAFSGQTTFSYAPTDTTLSQASVIINPTTSAANGQLLGLFIAGYQKALIDEDGDIILGYSDATSAPASDYPLNIYGHSGTRVAYIDTTGALSMGTSLTSSGALTITPSAGTNLNVALSTTGDFAVNTNQLYVDTSTGDVGIGTTNPNTFRLAIEKTGNVYAALRSNTGTAAILYYYTPSNGLTGGSPWYAGIYDSPTYRYSIGQSSEILSILPAGYVGIGTTAPSEKLVLESGGASSVGLRLNRTTATTTTGTDIGRLDFYNGSNWIAEIDTMSANGVATSGDISFWTANASSLTEKMRLTYDGKLGIGTTAPTSKLHVSGAVTGKALAIFDETGDQNILVASASGTNRFVITNAGLVGIGTTNPGSILTVLGGDIVVREDDDENNAVYLGADNGGGVIRLYNGSTNTVIVDGRSSQPIVFNNGGNVGIGTTAPSYPLDIYSSSDRKFAVDTSGNIILNNSTTDQNELQWGGGAYIRGEQGGRRISLNSIGQGYDGVHITTTSSHTNSSDSAVSLRITQTYAQSGTAGYDTLLLNVTETTTGSGNKNLINGKVGGTSVFTLNSAGTISASQFSTAGYSGDAYYTGQNFYRSSSNTTFTFYNDGNAASGISLYGSTHATTPNITVFNNASAESMRILANGNVGIGTTAPTSKLHVSGKVTGKALAIFDETGDQNILVASASGTNRFVITNAGNVGIGTTSPINKFVVSNSDAEGIEFIPGVSTNLDKLIFYKRSNNSYDAVLFTAADYRFDISGSEKVRIDASGFVGIGTTAPTSKLHVSGAVTGKALAIFDETGDQNILVASASGTNRFVIKNDGKVGIGTTSPGTTLDVNGIFGIAGKFRFLESGGSIYWQSSNTDYGTNQNIMVAQGDSSSITALMFYTGVSSEKMRIDSSGNVGIGTTSFGTSAAKVLALAGSTAPTTAITDGIQLYAVDASGSHELKVMDEAGNATTLSPHNFSLIEEGPSEEIAWSYYSERDGLAVNVDMTKALRIVENLSGEKLIYEKDLVEGVEIDQPMATESAAVTKDEWNVLSNLLDSLKAMITDIETKLSAMAEKFTTKESHQEKLCVGTSEKETCVTQEQLDTLIKLIPSPTPTATPTPSPTPVPSIEPSPESTSSATISAEIL